MPEVPKTPSDPYWDEEEEELNRLAPDLQERQNVFAAKRRRVESTDPSYMTGMCATRGSRSSDYSHITNTVVHVGSLVALIYLALLDSVGKREFMTHSSMDVDSTEYPALRQHLNRALHV
eukprot:2920090-Amphidinium_carterae.2